jgi:hypothetical protein
MNLNGLIPAPTMSTSGWVTDAEGKFDRLLSYYLTSTDSQSNIIEGGTKSFAYMVARYGHSPAVLASNLREDLNRLFSEYYNKAQVSVEIDNAVFGEDSNRYSITISISAYDVVIGTPNEIRYARLIDVKNSIVQSISKYNNEGEYDFYK